MAGHKRGGSFGWSYPLARKALAYQAQGVPDGKLRSQLASCFSHLDQIVGRLKRAIEDAGGVAFEVRTAAPSDAITSAGAAGQYSLPSRDLIASDIEGSIVRND